jgi:hypothetical protein
MRVMFSSKKRISMDSFGEPDLSGCVRGCGKFTLDVDEARDWGGVRTGRMNPPSLLSIVCCFSLRLVGKWCRLQGTGQVYWSQNSFLYRLNRQGGIMMVSLWPVEYGNGHTIFEIGWTRIADVK